MDKLSTENVDNSHELEALWIMWKTYPPALWKNLYLLDISGENVDKLSTENVDNSHELETLWIMWKTYPHSRWISFDGEKIVRMVEILQLVHSDCG